MANLGEAPGRRRADFLRRRLAGDEFGKPRLDGVETLAQRVIFGVGNFGRVILIVRLVVAFDLKCQPCQLNLGLGFGQFVYRYRCL
jgi:hypothetical protein